ncbi:MAG: helix-turn-helix transcriptional regulator [Thermoleophilia bacterium]
MRVRGSDKSSRLVEVGGSSDQVSKVDLMLLGLLLKRPTYGYEITEELSTPRMEPWVKLGRTSVYYALGRLARKDLVSRHAERHGARPERAVYSITDAGRRVFVDGLRGALEQAGDSTGSFDVALYFCSYLENQQVQDALTERWRALEQGARVTREALSLARTSGDHGLVLVLEHREKVLSTEITHVQELIRYVGASSGPLVGTFSGSLRNTLIQDVLRNLAVGNRSGVLQVSTSGGSLAFVLDGGDVTGVGQVEAGAVADRLREIFSDADGSYEFRENAPEPEPVVPVAGLIEVILLGTRGTVGWDLLRRMLPEERTLLEEADGGAWEIIREDLSEDEFSLLSVLDGVRTPAELSRHLGWTIQRFATAAYPLWTAGYIRRTDNKKRELATAIVKYLDRWAEMLQVMAGGEGVSKVFADVSSAARSAGIIDLEAARRDFVSVRFSLGVAALAEAGRSHASFVREAAASMLGRGFVEDAERGLKHHFGEDHRSVLAEYGIE